MRELYGELEIVKIIDDDEVIINNEFFTDKIKAATDGAIQLFLALLLLEHSEEQKNFTMEEICEFAGIATRTFKKHIISAVQEGLINKTKRGIEKQKGEKYKYYTNTLNFSDINGFTHIKASLIDLLLAKKFTGAEVTLYLYMKYKTNNREKECWMTQKNLAKEIGKTQSAISKLTDVLHAKRFILKKTEKIGRKKHSTYILKR